MLFPGGTLCPRTWDAAGQSPSPPSLTGASGHTPPHPSNHPSPASLSIAGTWKGRTGEGVGVASPAHTLQAFLASSPQTGPGRSPVPEETLRVSPRPAGRGDPASTTRLHPTGQCLPAPGHQHRAPGGPEMEESRRIQPCEQHRVNTLPWRIPHVTGCPGGRRRGWQTEHGAGFRGTGSPPGTHLCSSFRDTVTRRPWPRT